MNKGSFLSFNKFQEVWLPSLQKEKKTPKNKNENLKIVSLFF